MTGNRCAVLLAALFVGPAPTALAAQVAADTTVAHSVSLGKPLTDLLGGVAALVEEGFRTGDAERISRTARDLSFSQLSSGARRAATFAHRVRYRDRLTSLNVGLTAVGEGAVDVRFQSPDGVLIAAIRDVAWKAYLASLSPVEKVRVSVKEDVGPQQARPTLVLAVETVREYGCLGYRIDHAFGQRADTLRLELFGISSPRGSCSGMLGPALLRRPLRLPPGRYALMIYFRATSDRLVLEVTDSSTALTPEQTSFVEADERVRWRYPRRSFAVSCGNVAAARALCDDVARWLTRRPGVSQLRFAPEGLNPYLPDTAGNPDERVMFFRYSEDRDLVPIRRCFAEIDGRIREAVGVFVMLRTWTGEQITASSLKAEHEPHVAVPGQVTAGPRCAGKP